MKEKFQSFKEKLTTDKKFKTQFISIATACVVVIVLAIAIPVGIHNSKVPSTPVESESSSQNNEFEISLTANVQAEITTEAQTEPETEAQTQATQPAPKPTQSVTKAQKPAQSATKPAQSATKPAAKPQTPGNSNGSSSGSNNGTAKSVEELRNQMPPQDRAEFDKLPAGLQQDFVDRGMSMSDAHQAAGYYNDDAKTMNLHNSGATVDEWGCSIDICPRCGKVEGYGSHGTCLHVNRDKNCTICGEPVKAGGCHTCKW